MSCPTPPPEPSSGTDPATGRENPTEKAASHVDIIERVQAILQRHLEGTGSSSDRSMSSRLRSFMSRVLPGPRVRERDLEAGDRDANRTGTSLAVVGKEEGLLLSDAERVTSDVERVIADAKRVASDAERVVSDARRVILDADRVVADAARVGLDMERVGPVPQIRGRSAFEWISKRESVGTGGEWQSGLGPDS
ncbi:uncharacterized protein DNG_01236 [Cephalotrichum gorgonifer]|uniref:Uncharacterized protein n=1 Tax=Cephalotrichum gorgonifer TaxID=2041049 RepID=A0AAE8SRZ9_9PEZI|nr:uncharacterized protein DNG_01236 [Cephalotrichum gorgonifer]